MTAMLDQRGIAVQQHLLCAEAQQVLPGYTLRCGRIYGKPSA
ncbi:MAG: hypothetical protein ABI488_15455 [Polyangiaceae bacterium]